MKRFLAGWLGMLLVVLAPTRAARAEEGSPTVFDMAYQGLLVGGTVGVATGYFFARENGWHSSDWRPIAYGAGIGALAGATLGLTLGTVDMAQGRPGRLRFVMRDMAYGATFGAVVGGITGGLFALSGNKPERILLGGAIGIVSGAGLGFGFGLLDGRRPANPPPSSPPPFAGEEARSVPPRLVLQIMPTVAPDGRVAILPMLAGRY